ncbi:MAG: DUF969 domain-containing protein [Oscillospiraceae bacterium]|nr:DUF969 domain-containing protein [Oscillospiraceae bacterium]
MGFSEIITLVGVLIVILGFAFKLDAILIIMLAAIVTALVGGLGPVDMLETLGSTFVGNRPMAIFIMIMLVIGTLERNGLRESAAKLIAKVKGSTPGMVLGAYGIMRSIFAAFNVSFGGVAGFVRPVVMPMMEGAVEAKGKKMNEKHLETLKGMGGGIENIAWFFCQVLFVGGAGGLLVQSTLANLETPIHVELLDLVIISIPVAIFAVLTAIVVYYIRDRKMMKKYYGSGASKSSSKKSVSKQKDGGGKR